MTSLKRRFLNVSGKNKRFESVRLFGLLSVFGFMVYASLAVAHPVLPSLAPMLQQVVPAVVNINVRGEVSVPEMSSSDQGGSADEVPSRKFESLGSGVIVDAVRGYILTNAHLVREAKVINVKLSDGRSITAKLIGMDPPSDIAVLQIKAQNLHALAPANSDTLKVGDYIAAIGNPFGLSQTVTSGIVSGLERSDLHIEGYENFIQTDASINPGNSGGALVNMKGELVGINTAILATSGGSIGISFAIPSNMAKAVMDQIIQYGSVRRGLLGVLVQNFSLELAGAFHTPVTQGAVVTLVTPGSPAEHAGIRVGDLILSIDTVPMKNALQLRNVIGLKRAGSNVVISLMRGSHTMTVSVKIADPKVYQKQSESLDPILFGLALRDFDEQNPNGQRVRGVEVLYVTPNTAAHQSGLGLRIGDVIVSANQKPVTNVDELKRSVHESKKGVLLNILRQGGALFIVLRP